MSRFPGILRKKFLPPGEYKKIKNLLNDKCLNTVCQSAKCPNQFECFNSGTATFLIMGPNCTRSCRFCSVHKAPTIPLDPEEPFRLAEAAADMNLKYVVITSVTRDDLPDGGAAHFARCIEECRKMKPDIKIEVLIPDLLGSAEALKIVLDAKPDVLNHNVETVPRLYSVMRPEADYSRSVNIFNNVRAIAPDMMSKSGIMVGLGEEKEEVISVMSDLREAGCSILTIGQYLQPEKKAHPVVKMIEEDTYAEYTEAGNRLGFRKVFAGPFVRSSYHAEDIFSGA